MSSQIEKKSVASTNPIIRESITLDPISSERMDVMGNIHRYNFGWVKTSKIVGGPDTKTKPGGPDTKTKPGGPDTKTKPGGPDTKTKPDVIVVDQSTTGISGDKNVFDDKTTQEVLSPSLDTPEVKHSTVMDKGITLHTFYRFGIKHRTMVRTRAVGKSKILQLGEQSYSIMEEKEYANSMGQSTDSSITLPVVEFQAAEGGMTISIANGVKTKTTIKG